jgi:alpha-beta hydrolase superfamily lysophospholipase
MLASQCEPFELRTSDGLSLRARAWEPKSDARCTVGVVHGLGEHSGRYDHFARRFNLAGCRVLAFDLRGHGASPGRRGHVDRFARLLDDIELLVEEMKGRGPSTPRVLYGQSLGGSLVLSYAMRRQPQVDGLIITSPLFETTKPPPGWKLAAARLMVPILPWFTLGHGIRRDEMSHDPDAVAQRKEDALMHDRISARLGLSMLAEGRWLLTHAEHLNVPTLLMHGIADSVTSAEASVTFADRAGTVCTLKLWKEMLHELQWETDRGMVFDYALDWIQRTIHEA